MTTGLIPDLAKDWNINPVRIYAGMFETSLNGPGFSISLGNLSAISRALNHDVSEFIQLLDAPTTAPAWPKNGYAHAPSERDVTALPAQADNDSAEALHSGPQGRLFPHFLYCTRATHTNWREQLARHHSNAQSRKPAMPPSPPSPI